MDHPIRRDRGRRPAIGRGVAVAVLVAVTWAVTFPASAGESTDEAVARLASAAGCSTGPQDYVAGYWADGHTTSGVFWCRRGERYVAEGGIVIVVVERRAPRLACLPSVASINEPRGLRVLREQRMPLSWFVERDAPWRKGPAGLTTSDPVIDTGADGSGEQWVCHRGVWLVRVYH
jgi:hypothetical protein